MKDKLVTFKTAELAKLKGFRYSVEDKAFAYFNDGTLSKKNDVLSIVNEAINKKQFINCFIPTQSLLQCWLREMHQTHCVVKPYKHSSYKCKYESILMHESFKGDSEFNKTNVFNTYEEALEDCIRDGLAMIEVDTLHNQPA